jgi:hypothetical protein
MVMTSPWELVKEKGLTGRHVVGITECKVQAIVCIFYIHCYIHTAVLVLLSLPDTA